MRENVGRTDRIIRSILGPGLFAVGVHQLRAGRWLGLIGVVAGAVVLETAITRVCPFNSLLGLDTRSTTQRMRDFRSDINEQSDRIAAEYSEPIAIDETTVRP